jgi:hypothetical protein
LQARLLEIELRAYLALDTVSALEAEAFAMMQEQQAEAPRPTSMGSGGRDSMSARLAADPFYSRAGSFKH